MEDLSKQFMLLKKPWPELYDIAFEAEQNVKKNSLFCAIRLRYFCEIMASELLNYSNIYTDNNNALYDNINLLVDAKILDTRISSRFHALRIAGNHAVHNNKPPANPKTLINDAGTLAKWFCFYTKTDVVSDTSDAADILSSKEAPIDLPLPETIIPLDAVFEHDLTNDQRQCLTAIEDFLKNESSKIFLLKGYAGTGKTFLAKGITDYLLAQGRQFLLMAPTGRAAKIIVGKTKLPAYTVHRSIYDYRESFAPIDEDDGDEEVPKFQSIATISENTTTENCVTIIDEASLISDVFSKSEYFQSGSGYLLTDLIEFVGLNHHDNQRKIIFIGDPAQLPPVHMENSPALDAKYIEEKFSLKAEGYELTEIVRQKADSNVLQNIIPIRDSLIAHHFGGISFNFDDELINLDIDRVPQIYAKIRNLRGVQAPIIVCDSNKKAAHFNKAIRAIIFPENEKVTANDIVIVCANINVGQRFLTNGEIIRVASAASTIERRNVRIKQKVVGNDKAEYVDVALNFRNIKIAIAQEDGYEAVIDVKILDDFLHGDHASLEAEQQQALLVDFLTRFSHLRKKEQQEEFRLSLRSDPYFNALRLKFGYAITCHKAQGGEWSHVFVDCPTHQNPRTSSYFRWLYTAMTRTNNKLYLVNPPNVQLLQVGQGWSQNDSNTTIPSNSPKSSAEIADKNPVEPIVSPDENYSIQSSFFNWLQNNISQLLLQDKIEISDVTHHQYRETYFLKKEIETARIDINYKSNWTISKISSPQSDLFIQKCLSLLQSLEGKKLIIGQAHSCYKASRPFLQNFHERLTKSLMVKGIALISIEELAWNLRYVVSRDNQTASFDVFYNGKEQFTKFMPVQPAKNPSSKLVELQNEITKMLTEEVKL